MKQRSSLSIRSGKIDASVPLFGFIVSLCVSDRKQRTEEATLLSVGRRRGCIAELRPEEEMLRRLARHESAQEVRRELR